MGTFFFSGSVNSKLDEKNRFVLPQDMRFGFVEEGKLEFTVAISLGGCLAIYKRSDIEKIVQKFQRKQHIAQYQKFFTLFFSTLHHTSCDKLGRVVIPSVLKNAVGIKNDIVIAGVLNKVEVWPKEKYENDLSRFLNAPDENDELSKMMEEAFALLGEEETKETNTSKISEEAWALLDERNH